MKRSNSEANTDQIQYKMRLIEELARSSPKRLDIITGLIDRNLDSIAQSVFLYFNDLDDLINAIEANPKWIDALNSKQWLSKYFAIKKKTTWPNMILLQIWQRMRETHSTSCILEEASSRYTRLKKNATRRPGGIDEYSIVIPFECLDLTFPDIHINSDFCFILFKSKSRRSVINSTLPYRHHDTLLVYNRWTLELVNAMSVHGELELIGVPNDGTRLLPLFNTYFDNSRQCSARTIILNLSTANVTTLETAGLLFLAQFESNQLVIHKFEQHGTQYRKSVTIYELKDNEVDGRNQLTVLKEDALMPNCGLIRYLPGNPNLDCVACLFWDGRSLQTGMRSKRDLSLLIQTRPFPPTFQPFKGKTYLLSEDLLAGIDKYRSSCSIKVRSLLDNENSVAYEFVPSFPFLYVDRFIFSDGHLVALLRICVKYGDRKQCEAVVVYWQLPANFLDECRKHLADGTVGNVRECRVVEKAPRNGYNSRSYCEDQFGITEIEIERSLKTDQCEELKLTFTLFPASPEHFAISRS